MHIAAKINTERGKTKQANNKRLIYYYSLFILKSRRREKTKEN